MSYDHDPSSGVRDLWLTMHSTLLHPFSDGIAWRVFEFWDHDLRQPAGDAQGPFAFRNARLRGVGWWVRV
jgi:hypothetical protein